MKAKKSTLASASKQPGSPAQAALDEIRRRAAAGQPLNSGANRGDWLYAAAARFFGSWGAAVAAAGFDYDEHKQVDLSAGEVLRRIRALVAEHGQKVHAGDHPLVSAGARRHFGGWKAAFEAAGCGPPETLTWTREAVVAAIREDLANGLRVNSVAMVRRNGKLYVAGRRRFGSWAAALVAANDAEATQPAARRRSPKARAR